MRSNTSSDTRSMVQPAADKTIKNMPPSVGDCLRSLFGLLAAAGLTLLLLYTLHHDLYRDLLRMCAHSRRETPTPTATMLADADADAVRADPEEPPPPGSAAEDVREYTVGGSTRTRILHPRTKDALQRLRDEARADPNLLTQVTVTSSAQYPDVTPEMPLLINTYK